MSIETFFAAISSAFVPVMAALILAYGLLHNAPVYDYFIEGAKKGLATALATASPPPVCCSLSIICSHPCSTSLKCLRSSCR